MEAMVHMEVEGPIQMQQSRPFGSAALEGSEQDQLLKKFDYVEEEFFIGGVAPVYGPESARALQPGEDPWSLKPLSTVSQPDAPYRTRIQVIRPQEAGRFSGIVQVIPFHVLSSQASVERHLLRHGDVWIGVELCEGTRFGRGEVPTGGLANLRRADPARYGELSIAGGDPSQWGALTPGALGRAFEGLNWGEAGPEVQVFVQELFRSYAQAPGIFFDLARAIRGGEGGILPGWPVRRVYTSGASATAQILRPFIDYHHDANLLPGSVAPVDGYFIRVGVVPENRPTGAVVVVFNTEAEAMHQVSESSDLPEDSDQPPFRYYEVPGTGHRFSAVLDGDQHSTAVSEMLPPGVEGLTGPNRSTEYERYDKFNAPIEWALWYALYSWVEEAIPMPRAQRITRNPDSPDGIARDLHGNALGGLRTPWVDVPDARYVARISSASPLDPGMQPFGEEKMQSLYGSRKEYQDRVRAKLEEMVSRRWLLAEDVPEVFALSVH
jgi:hypothetical protein